MAIFIATELNVTADSLQVDVVGNGHIHKTMIAWTVDTVYGGLDISAQRILDT